MPDTEMDAWIQCSIALCAVIAATGFIALAFVACVALFSLALGPPVTDAMWDSAWALAVAQMRLVVSGVIGMGVGFAVLAVLAVRNRNGPASNAD